MIQGYFVVELYRQKSNNERQRKRGGGIKDEHILIFETFKHWSTKLLI